MCLCILEAVPAQNGHSSAMCAHALSRVEKEGKEAESLTAWERIGSAVVKRGGGDSEVERFQSFGQKGEELHLIIEKC